MTSMVSSALRKVTVTRSADRLVRINTLVGSASFLIGRVGPADHSDRRDFFSTR
ncbi:hypothetical protein AB0M34_04835 [Nocardia sp. NPDC050193]